MFHSEIFRLVELERRIYIQIIKSEIVPSHSKIVGFWKRCNILSPFILLPGTHSSFFFSKIIQKTLRFLGITYKTRSINRSERLSARRSGCERGTNHFPSEIGIAIIFVSHRAHYTKLGSDPQSLDCLNSRGYYLGVLGPTGTGWQF